MVYVFTAVFQPAEEGGYTVIIPDVPGCVTEGDTLTEATLMAKDALALCLCSMEDRAVEIASPRSPEEIQKEYPEAVLVMVDSDTKRYRMENDNRAVRKNVSIPAWLNFKAEQANVNFSQILQEGLKQHLNL